MLPCVSCIIHILKFKRKFRRQRVNISMRCSVFDRHGNFWWRKLSYIEEMESSTSETFVFMHPSYVALYFSTDRHENLKRKFAINHYTTAPKEQCYIPKRDLVVLYQKWRTAALQTYECSVPCLLQWIYPSLPDSPSGSWPPHCGGL
jgi:hypothetical protein